MKVRHLIALAAALTVSSNVLAADNGQDLFKKHSCSQCHRDAQPSTGPTPKQIAAKNAGDKGAQAKLEAKVRNGVKGTEASYGKMPMPPQTAVSDADIKTMVAWLLGQK